jgi:formyltetrahydrofolate deformylase
MTSPIVLIECEDRKGLIHAITGVIAQYSLNIVTNHEFVDRDAGRFFMRTEVEGPYAPDGLEDALRVVLPAGAMVRLSSDAKRRIVIMVTKEHHCLGDLLLRIAFGELSGIVAAVIGNHAALEPLARQFGIPFHEISHEALSREAHEQKIISTLDRYAPDYIVLARYMRVLSPAFVAAYANRIINIHHSFLPAFIGANPYLQAYNRGVKIIGATAHFVTDNLDDGPIIAQSITPVDHQYGVVEMVQAGRDIEKTVLARALKLVFEDRVFLSGRRTIIFQ